MELWTGVLPQRNCSRLSRPSLRSGKVNERFLPHITHEQCANLIVVQVLALHELNLMRADGDKWCFRYHINVFKYIDMFLATKEGAG